MNTNSLQQHVNEPTRGNNNLDLVMTTTDLGINGLEVTDKICDHQMIDFSLEIQDPNTRTQHKQVLDYKQENFEPMKEELGRYNYGVLMSIKNAEECYMTLKDKIATATDHHIPKKRIRPTNNPPWFSQEIKRLINARQHSYRRLERYQTEPHRQEHIHACRAVKRTIKSTKRNKDITVAAPAKTNPKSFYKYVNDRRLRRDTIGPPIDSKGSTQTNNKRKAKNLNTYFTSVFTHEGLTEILQPHVLNTQEILSDGVFTVEEVEEQLSILNPYKSTGPDGLGPRILKESAEVISEPLTNIFNRSLETGIVPVDWKHANFTSIFKKRNKQIPNNYRPISLTSVISKTIERLLKVRMTKHLNDQNLINDTQHGFREKRSCLTNLLYFFGEVNCTYDRTKAVDLVYLDFQKAFDKVPTKDSWPKWKHMEYEATTPDG
ncbi:Reverse transcriptase domain [Trinorchestia longiramus]|nr:Reverse transcriptase domain [Trinorchestia longiramus]